MKKILILIFLSIELNAISQDYKIYTRHIEMAKYYKSQNIIDSSLLHFDKAYACADQFICFDNLTAAKMYLQVGDTLKGMRCVEALISSGFDSNIGEEIGLAAANSVNTACYNVNYQGLDEILELYGVDQYVRQRFQGATMVHQMALADSVCYVRLKNIIDTYGFPGYNNIGMFANRVLVMIMHIITNDSTNFAWDDYFEELLLNEAAKGNIKYSDYALLADRYTMVFYGWQKYGLKVMRTSNGKEFLPFKDIQVVDSCRNAIGLAPLYYHAKFINAKLPDNYHVE